MLWRLTNLQVNVVVDKVLKFLKGYPGIALSALLIMLSFPSYNLYFLSFFFFIPAIFSINEEPSFKIRVIKSSLWGFLIFLFTFYWTIITIHHFGKINIGFAIVLFIPLAFYQMLPFILWLLTFNYQFKKSIVIPALSFSLLTHFMPLIFPYSISSSLAPSLYFPQVADLAGEWGLDFLIIIINLLIYKVIITKQYKKMLIPSAVVFLMFSYGYYKVNFHNNNLNRTLEVVVIQPVIKDSDNDRTAMKKLFSSIESVNGKCEGKTVILPESSIPDSLGMRADFFTVIEEIRSQLKADRIIYNHTVFKDGKLYNASFLTGKKGTDMYFKNKLMLFGEKFPCHKLIQKLPLYIANFASFDSGDEIKTLKDEGISFATPICLEAIYQGYTAELSENAGIIVNQTNDEWFGNTKATFLHFAQVKLKAIENRKFLIRSTNTGYTSVVNEFGEDIASLQLNKPGILNVKVKLNNKKTVFQKIFKIIPVVYFLLLLYLLFGLRLRKD